METGKKMRELTSTEVAIVSGSRVQFGRASDQHGRGVRGGRRVRRRDTRLLFRADGLRGCARRLGRRRGVRVGRAHRLTNPAAIVHARHAGLVGRRSADESRGIVRKTDDLRRCPRSSRCPSRSRQVGGRISWDRPATGRSHVTSSGDLTVATKVSATQRVTLHATRKWSSAIGGVHPFHRCPVRDRQVSGRICQIVRKADDRGEIVRRPDDRVAGCAHRAWPCRVATRASRRRHTATRRADDATDASSRRSRAGRPRPRRSDRGRGS